MEDPHRGDPGLRGRQVSWEQGLTFVLLLALTASVLGLALPAACCTPPPDAWHADKGQNF